MKKEEQELEKYLSEFRPRPVRPLGIANRTERVWVGRLAAAAAVILSIGIGFWYAGHPQKHEVKSGPIAAQPAGQKSETSAADLNSIRLTKLALDDEKRFETELQVASRRMLPDFRSPDSSLKVFAKE